MTLSGNKCGLFGNFDFMSQFTHLFSHKSLDLYYIIPIMRIFAFVQAKPSFMKTGVLPLLNRWYVGKTIFWTWSLANYTYAFFMLGSMLTQITLHLNISTVFKSITHLSPFPAPPAFLCVCVQNLKEPALCLSKYSKFSSTKLIAATHKKTCYTRST